MNTTILDDGFDTPRDPIEPLILDLLEWIGPGARPYSEAIEVWRTSCPRLPVWEDACARGYLTRAHLPGGVAEVALSQAGAAYLRASRGVPLPPQARHARLRGSL